MRKIKFRKRKRTIHAHAMRSAGIAWINCADVPAQTRLEYKRVAVANAVAELPWMARELGVSQRFLVGAMQVWTKQFVVTWNELVAAAERYLP